MPTFSPLPTSPLLVVERRLSSHFVYKRRRAATNPRRQRTHRKLRQQRRAAAAWHYSAATAAAAMNASPPISPKLLRVLLELALHSSRIDARTPGRRSRSADCRRCRRRPTPQACRRDDVFDATHYACRRQAGKRSVCGKFHHCDTRNGGRK